MRCIADLLRPTGNPNDAFWLAQTHLLTHQYSQAEGILTALRSTSPPSTEFASSSTPPPGSPSSSSQNGEMKRLTDTSLACRYLAAQCQVRLGKWEEALEMVGRGNGNWSAWDGETDQGDGPGDGGIKVRKNNSARSTHLTRPSPVHRFDRSFARVDPSAPRSVRSRQGFVHRSAVEGREMF